MSRQWRNEDHMEINFATFSWVDDCPLIVSWFALTGRLVACGWLIDFNWLIGVRWSGGLDQRIAFDRISWVQLIGIDALVDLCRLLESNTLFVIGQLVDYNCHVRSAELIGWRYLNEYDQSFRCWDTLYMKHGGNQREVEKKKSGR